MQFVSFDPLRTLDIPHTRPLKPTEWFQMKEKVRSADWILFPEYWQINALVYGWKKRIFPSISSYHLGHNKIEMTRAFEAILPNAVPFTRIVPNTCVSQEYLLDLFTFPFIAKEVRSSMGMGVFLIENRQDFLKYANGQDTLYIQEYLPIHRDLRIVVIGRNAVTAYWRIAKEGCFHNNVSRGGIISFDDIPNEAIDMVETIARELNINHAGFDVAEVDGNFYLLEFNVLFGGKAFRQCSVKPGTLIYKYLLECSTEPSIPDYPKLPKAS
jgi:ribosomal protein S6--L-glutamate ligase